MIKQKYQLKGYNVQYVITQICNNTTYIQYFEGFSDSLTAQSCITEQLKIHVEFGNLFKMFCKSPQSLVRILCNEAQYRLNKSSPLELSRIMHRRDKLKENKTT